MTIPTSFEQVTANSSDGAQMGKSSSEKNAFYGATPVVQPSGSSQAAVVASLLTTVAATALSTVAVTAATTANANGYSTNTQADAIPVRINQLVVDANVFDAKINQAVVDIGALTTLVNQLRAEVVTLGLIAGA